MLCGRGVLCWFCADCSFHFTVCVCVCVCVCVELCAVSSIDTTVIKPVIQGQACVCMCKSSHTLPEGHVSLSHTHTGNSR